MNKEREKLILEQLLIHKKITVKELSAKLYISQPSIRRDLKSLEAQNLIKRIHGGAILEDNPVSLRKIPFALRELEESDAKIIMAKTAATLINDNDTIFLDASSSAYNIIPYLPLKNNITVITNGVKALQKLAEYNISTISTGGELINSCLSLVGDDAVRTVERYNADIMFFSCRGLSKDGQLTDIFIPENSVRMKMLRHAKKSYLLCASNKIGTLYYHNLCTADDITGIISEHPLPQSLMHKDAANHN